MMEETDTIQTIRPEWSHRIEADDIGATPVRTKISASPQERKDIARRLGVETVQALEANLVLKRLSGKMMIHVSGAFTAHVTQKCVVTLEPVAQVLDGTVEGWFAETGGVVPIGRARRDKQVRNANANANAEVEMLDEREDPEPVIDGQIDLGELVVQHLALSLDPYPHKEGVVFEHGEDGAVKPVSPPRQNPFAALKDWKNRQKQEKP